MNRRLGRQCTEEAATITLVPVLAEENYLKHVY
jgi:hypothetical protein